MFAPSTPAAADPLHGNNVSASGGHQNNNNNNNNQDMFDAAWNDGNEMWYLAPGPAFFQNLDSNSVNMTAEGVHVGGMDLLEYMAMDPDTQNFGVMDSHF